MIDMVDSYMEDCEHDPELKCYDNSLRTELEVFLKRLGDGRVGIPLDGLKGYMATVCGNNKYITKTIMEATKEEIEWMAREEDCFDIVLKYFEITSEMLDFCHELDKFVVSARTGHNYIAHVIQQLEKDYGTETVDVNGNRDRFKAIVEIFTNLKSSAMVGRVSTESLFEKIKCLTEKFNQMTKDLGVHQKKYTDMMEEKLMWKRITRIIFIGCLVAVGVAAAVTTALVFAQPQIVVMAGAVANTAMSVTGSVKVAALGVISKGLVSLASNQNTIRVTASILLDSLPPLVAAEKWAGSMFLKTISEIQKKKTAMDSMQAASYTAIKELGDIKNLIDKLVTYIDILMNTGNLGANPNGDYDMGFAMKEIKGSLAIFLQRIEELDTEAKSCVSQIKKARDDVLKKVKKVQHA